jgi:hypothetical protein
MEALAGKRKQNFASLDAENKEALWETVKSREE